MKVKNFIVNNLDTTTELLIKGLCINNIDYVLIKDDRYSEIHYLDNIYRFFDMNNKNMLKELLIQSGNEIREEEDTMRVNINIDLYASLDDMKLCLPNNKINKKPGYKVLKKADYKRKQAVRRCSSKNRNR